MSESIHAGRVARQFLRRTTLQRWLSVVGIAATGVFALAGCGGSPAVAQAPPPAAEVSVAQVLTRTVSQWDDFSGRVASVESVDLRPRVSGYVQRVAYREGQEVNMGDLLFVIDQRRYRAQLQRAQAELERARAEAGLARAQHQRAQALVDAQAISREEFETRRAASSQGDAGVRAAEAAVASARLDLAWTQVRAPISGRAGRAMVTAGNLAQADQTVLTSVVSQDPMYVYFETDEQTWLRYARMARSGERASARNPVRIALAGEDGYPHTGSVDFTDNQVDPGTGTIRARALVDNPQRILAPGLFARVQLQGSGERPALLIDDKAVLTDQDRKYVYVLGSKNEAVRKDVVLGSGIDGLRVVTSGLGNTDRVVIGGVQKIFFPGMPLKARMVAMQSPAAATTAMR